LEKLTFKKSQLSVEMELQELLAFVKETQGALKWDSASLIRVGGQLAVKVNGIKNLSGQEKQALICQILKTVLEDVEKKEKSETTVEEEKAAIAQQFASLRKTVDEVLPASLDLALAAARGKLDLKKVKMSVWVKYFSCCAKSVVTALASSNVISQAQAKQATDALAAVEVKAAVAAEAADAGCEGPAAAGCEGPAAAANAEEDKTKFEQENPMRTAIQEEAKTESQSEQTSATA
jgi:hypothetical protein